MCWFLQTCNKQWCTFYSEPAFFYSFLTTFRQSACLCYLRLGYQLTCCLWSLLIDTYYSRSQLALVKHADILTLFLLTLFFLLITCYIVYPINEQVWMWRYNQCYLIYLSIVIMSCLVNVFWHCAIWSSDLTDLNY